MLDGSGNVLRHKVIRFRLEGLTTGQAEQVLSGCLDEVFRMCDSTKKPFAKENLKLKHVAEPYGPKWKNFVTGRFAFSKITSLAESKALRHSAEIRKVNPAYTSQAGKMLFVKKYGMSIHEAASAVIGRRAMGIREKLPEKLRKGLKDDLKNSSRMRQWAAAYRATKYRHCGEAWDLTDQHRDYHPGGDKGGETGGDQGVDWTARKEKVLAEIRKEPAISTTRMADHLHLSRRQVEKTLDQLKNEGRLYREGSARSGHWVINE